MFYHILIVNITQIISLVYIQSFHVRISLTIDMKMSHLNTQQS